MNFPLKFDIETGFIMDTCGNRIVQVAMIGRSADDSNVIGEQIVNLANSTQQPDVRGVLTLERLKLIEPGTVFARGEVLDAPGGCNMMNTASLLRFVAVKGFAPDDWTIYCGWASSSYEEILHNGEKPISQENIRACVNCDDQALARYGV